MKSPKLFFCKRILGVCCLALFSLFGLFTLFFFNYKISISDQHFIFLAKAFTEGNLYFNSVPSIKGWGDSTLFNNHYYWPLGIFPALLLIPPVLLFGTNFMQGYASFPIMLASAYLLYKIAENITKKKLTSLFLTFAYIFCTAYFKVAFWSASWYFAHVVADFCIISSLYFILVKPKPWLVGMFFSFSFLTRISIFLGITFFILYYWFYERDHFKERIIKFLIPVFVGLFIFCTYNYARFGSISETGYKTQILPPAISQNRDIGMWSFKHFSKNLYLFILKPPDIVYLENYARIRILSPNRWGMGFIFTSPILLYLVLTDTKNKLNRIALFSAAVIAFFLFGSFGLGAYQYGYRFSLDFQPFLFLVLFDIFRKREIGFFTSLVLYLSFIFNLVMVFLPYS
jgi:hypothetical protein